MDMANCIKMFNTSILKCTKKKNYLQKNFKYFQVFFGLLLHNFTRRKRAFSDQIVFYYMLSSTLITTKLQKLLTHVAIDKVKVILHVMVVQNDKGVFQLNAMSLQWY
jgi:hypothetical protein